MKNYHKGLLLVLGTALISGFSIFFNKFGIKGIEPSLFAGLKNLSVGFVLVAILILSKDWKRLYVLPRKEWAKLLLIGLVGGSVPFILFFNGLALSSGVKAGFIHKTLFIYVAILAAIFLKERITSKICIGCGALFIGIALFLNITPQALGLGDLMIFGATIFWAIEITISKHLLKNIKPTIVIASRMLVGGGLIWIYLLASGKAPLVFSLGAEHMNWAVITTVLLVGYVMTFYHGLKHVPAHVATAVLALGAPITLLLQVIFLDKVISIYQVGGMIIIALALVIITRNASLNKINLQHVPDGSN